MGHWLNNRDGLTAADSNNLAQFLDGSDCGNSSDGRLGSNSLGKVLELNSFQMLKDGFNNQSTVDSSK